MTRAQVWSLLDRWLAAEVDAAVAAREAERLKSELSHEIAARYPLESEATQ